MMNTAHFKHHITSAPIDDGVSATAQYHVNPRGLVPSMNQDSEPDGLTRVDTTDDERDLNLGGFGQMSVIWDPSRRR